MMYVYEEESEARRRPEINRGERLISRAREITIPNAQTLQATATENNGYPMRTRVIKSRIRVDVICAWLSFLSQSHWD